MEKERIVPNPPPPPATRPVEELMALHLTLSAVGVVLLLAFLAWMMVGGFLNTGVSSTGSDSSPQTEAPTLSDSIVSTTTGPRGSGYDLEARPLSTSTRYYSNQANLSFTIPQQWSQSDPDTVPLLLGLGEPTFVFTDQTKGCVFAAASLDRNAADYKQTSSARPNTGEVHYFNGTWYTDQSYHQREIEYSRFDRQYLDREVFVLLHNETVDLALFNPAGGPVSTECYREFTRLLSSLEYHFLPRALESYDSGVIAVERVRVREGNDRYLLVFTDERSGNTYKLLDLPTGVNGNRLFLAGNKLHFFASAPASDRWENSLDAYYEYDLQQQRLQRSDTIIDPTGPMVPSWFVASNTMYYLSTGTSSWRCISGPARDCELDLSSFPLTDPVQKTVLLEDVPATIIMGYAADSDELYLMTGYGDAGCIGLQLYTYDDGELGTLPQLGGCAHEFEGQVDAGYVQYQTEMSALRERLQVPSATAIRYHYGEYTLAPEADSYFGVDFVLVE